MKTLAKPKRAPPSKAYIKRAEKKSPTTVTATSDSLSAPRTKKTYSEGPLGEVEALADKMQDTERDLRTKLEVNVPDIPIKLPRVNAAMIDEAETKYQALDNHDEESQAQGWTSCSLPCLAEIGSEPTEAMSKARTSVSKPKTTAMTMASKCPCDLKTFATMAISLLTAALLGVLATSIPSLMSEGNLAMDLASMTNGVPNSVLDLMSPGSGEMVSLTNGVPTTNIDSLSSGSVEMVSLTNGVPTTNIDSLSSGSVEMVSLTNGVPTTNIDSLSSGSGEMVPLTSGVPTNSLMLCVMTWLSMFLAVVLNTLALIRVFKRMSDKLWLPVCNIFLQMRRRIDMIGLNFEDKMLAPLKEVTSKIDEMASDLKPLEEKLSEPMLKSALSKAAPDAEVPSINTLKEPISSVEKSVTGKVDEAKELITETTNTKVSSFFVGRLLTVEKEWRMYTFYLPSVVAIILNTITGVSKLVHALTSTYSQSSNVSRRSRQLLDVAAMQINYHIVSEQFVYPALAVLLAALFQLLLYHILAQSETIACFVNIIITRLEAALSDKVNSKKDELVLKMIMPPLSETTKKCNYVFPKVHKTLSSVKEAMAAMKLLPGMDSLKDIKVPSMDELPEMKIPVPEMSTTLGSFSSKSLGAKSLF